METDGHNITVSILVEQNADQRGIVHEVHQKQSETKSVVSINGKFESKYFFQYTVEIYLFFSDVEFS